MSSEPFVRLRGVGKAFKLYEKPWQQLADIAFGGIDAPEHWAVRGIDLDLKPGDCLGLVGRNGAGKSTLLELICGISRPSEGTIETNGRVAALLQLGAGFNREFTGRENVFLCAALYGLTTRQIEERYDAIVAFAGIGAFVDRPVREYSSGMFARLAFSVCVHVDADILIIDEILGVGDVRFQQSSMRYLRRFRRKGIVLFVSHDEHAVSALCRSAIWIEDGRLAASGPTKPVLDLYRRELSRRAMPGSGFTARDAQSTPAITLAPSPGMLDEPGFDPDDPPDVLPQPQGASAALESVHVTLAGRPLDRPMAGGEELSVSIRTRLAPSDARLVFTLRNPMGQIVLAGDSADWPQPMPEGAVFTFLLPYLPTGNYPIEVFLLKQDGSNTLCLDHRETAAVIEVLSHHISHGLANVRMTTTTFEVEQGGRNHGP